MKRRSKKITDNINIFSQRNRFLDGDQLVIDHLNGFLKRIDDNRDLNAFTCILSAEAKQRAQEIDKKIAAGKPLGKLAGNVIAIKDNISVKDIRTTCGSKILENYIPPYHATVIEKLLAEDAILVGKTNMDEFAMGSSTENSFFGVSLNPVAPDRVPGGSSGGSAVAVAAGLAQIALGSDTGGSIRQPAAFTGVVGLKPTYGRVSRYGLVAFASSLDQIGPLSRSVSDSALILEVISGKDKKDSTSAENPVEKFTNFLGREAKGLKVGIPDEYFEEGLNPEIQEMVMDVVAHLEKSGVEIHRVSLPHTRFGVSTYYIIATAEASSNLARYDGIKFGYRSPQHEDLIETYQHTRDEGFGDEVKRRIMLGTYVLSSGYYDAYYRKAQQVRRLIKNDFTQVFSHVDCIISPTTPTTAFKIGEKTENPLEMYLSDVYTVNANLAGIPALSIPVGFDSTGLPVGLQIMAGAYMEKNLFQLGDFIERTYPGNE